MEMKKENRVTYKMESKKFKYLNFIENEETVYACEMGFAARKFTLSAGEWYR